MIDGRNLMTEILCQGDGAIGTFMLKAHRGGHARCHGEPLQWKKMAKYQWNANEVMIVSLKGH